MITLIVVAALFLGACSGESHSSEAFCEELGRITGPQGAEVLFSPQDPARLDGLAAELSDLHDRAPDDIATTTAAMKEFFESYRRAPRDERRDLLVANERTLIDASTKLDDYALRECGLLLQRTVPTPLPTADPGVEIQPE